MTEFNYRARSETDARIARGLSVAGNQLESTTRSTGSTVVGGFGPAYTKSNGGAPMSGYEQQRKRELGLL